MPTGARVLKRDRVTRELRKSILSGSLPRGTLLPGENELAQQFDVSRTTIRGVLENLANDRLIETHTGVGSFVTFDGVQLNQAYSWGTALSSSGFSVSVEVLRIAREVDPDLATMVGSASMEFLAVDRIRRTDDGTAVSLERSRVPWIGSLREAPNKGLVNDSLSASLTAAGLTPARGEQWIAASPLSQADAEVTGRQAGEVFLNAVRVSRDSQGQFVERVVSWLDPTHFRLYVQHGS